MERAAGLLDERLRAGHLRRAEISTKRPHSLGTFLVDGAVAGGWRPDGERIALEPFEEIAPAAWREVEAEAAALARFRA